MYTNEEFIDTILVDCNDLIKACIEGQYIHFCQIVVQIANKLINLKSGIKDELANRDQTIEELKQTLRNAGMQVVDILPEELAQDNIGELGGSADGGN